MKTVIRGEITALSAYIKTWRDIINLTMYPKAVEQEKIRSEKNKWKKQSNSVVIKTNKQNSKNKYKFF